MKKFTLYLMATLMLLGLILLPEQPVDADADTVVFINGTPLTEDENDLSDFGPGCSGTAVYTPKKSWEDVDTIELINARIVAGTLSEMSTISNDGETYSVIAGIYSNRELNIILSGANTISVKTLGLGDPYEKYIQSYGIFLRSEQNYENLTITGTSKSDSLTIETDANAVEEIIRGISVDHLEMKDATITVNNNSQYINRTYAGFTQCHRQGIWSSSGGVEMTNASLSVNVLGNYDDTTPFNRNNYALYSNAHGYLIVGGDCSVSLAATDRALGYNDVKTYDYGAKYTALYSGNPDGSDAEPAVLTYSDPLGHNDYNRIDGWKNNYCKSFKIIDFNPWIFTFDLNGHGNAGSQPDPQEIVPGGKATKPTDPVDEKYDFKGWYADKNFENKWYFGSNKVNKDTTVYAKWVKKGQATHTVTFDPKGGTAIDSLTDVPHGSTISAPAQPTKDGFTFDGWYIDQACTQAWDFDNATVTTDITLYAKWVAEPSDLNAPATPVEVQDPQNLTEDEKAAVKKAVLAANPELPQDTPIVVADDGTVTVTYDGQSHTLAPAMVIRQPEVEPETESDDDEPWTGKVTSENDYLKLTDVEHYGVPLTQSEAEAMGGLELVVEDVSPRTLGGMILNEEEIRGRYNQFYDIYVRVKGTQERVDGISATVTLTDDVLGYTSVKAYVLNPVGGTFNYRLQELGMTVNGTEATFYGPHFSYYCLSFSNDDNVPLYYKPRQIRIRGEKTAPAAPKTESKVDAVKVDEPQVVKLPATGESGLPATLALSCAAIAVVFLILKKRR